MDLCFRKPLCLFVSNFVFCRNYIRRVFTIFSSILAMIFRRVIGLYPSTEYLSFFDLGIGMMLPFFHFVGMHPFFHMWLKMSSRCCFVILPKLCMKLKAKLCMGFFRAWTFAVALAECLIHLFHGNLDF